MCYETLPSFVFKTTLSSCIKIKYRPKKKKQLLHLFAHKNA